MAAEGFEVIPATSSDEISRYYSPNKNTLFIVDDFCGTYSLIEHELRTWDRKQKDIESLLKSKKIKIIVACRLQVSQDLLFETIPLFKSCVCDLMSSNLHLLRSERQELAVKYLASQANLVHNYLESFECFPLLCRLFFDNPTQNIVDFFKSPFRVYETEIQKLYKGKSHSKYCALALCVMFNNHVEEKWFIHDIDESQQKIFEATMEECKLSKGTPRRIIRDEIETLTKTFIRKDRIAFNQDGNNFYRTIHDKLFDFLVYHFGMTMPDSIIKYANFGLISKKFVFQKDNANDDFVVLLPDKYRCIYIDRVLNEWYRGNLNDVMTNVNMRSQMFRNFLLKNISTKDVEFQKTLATCKAKTSDSSCSFRYTFLPISGDGETCPLNEFCTLRDTNLIKWCCENGADVNQFNQKKKTPLSFACETGDVGLVKYLLKKNADVNEGRNSSCLPLYLASEGGYTEIVQMLLEQKAKVFTDILSLMDVYGKSQLYIACYNGHIDIVQLLLEDAKTRNYFYDSEPFLYTAYTRGHKTIVILLLQYVDVMKYTPKVNMHNSIFYVTCMRGDEDMVKILLDTKLAAQYKVYNYMYSADREKSPLWIACEKGYPKVVDVILGNERFVKECANSRESALYVACIKGNEQIVTQLLQNDVFTKHCTKEDIVRCLNETRINKHFTILEILLQNKIFIKNHPLQIMESACENGYTEHVRKFLIDQAFVDQCLYNYKIDNRLLCKACENDHTAIVKLFLTNDKLSSALICHKLSLEIVFIACRNGNEDIVNMLLSKFFDIKNSRELVSSLCIATEKGHTGVVKVLVQYAVSVNICGGNGKTPLHIASFHGHKEIVDILIQAGADIDDITSKDCETSLHLACKTNHIEIVGILLAKGADINRCTKLGETPLFISCELGFSSIVSFLLQNQADLFKCAENERNCGKSPLYIASSKGHLEIVQMLLQRDADVNKCAEGPRSGGQSPLFIACVFNHIDVVKALLKHGADVNKSVSGHRNKDQFPLSIACNKEHFEIVESLLTANASVNKRSKDDATSLYIAIEKKQHWSLDQEIKKAKIAHLLIDNGADVNLSTADGKTPLHIACGSGVSTGLVKRLLGNKSNVNGQANDGTTPLLNACCLRKKTDVVKLLLDNGACVNKSFKNGLSPLYRACQNNDVETVKVLLQKNPDVNRAIRGGRSPLLEACDKGNTEIVRLLLERKAKVNFYNKFRRTPLFFACQEGHFEIVKMLIQKNADINIVPMDGKTALHVACRRSGLFRARDNENTEIVRLLLQHHAKVNYCDKFSRSPLIFACQQGHFEIVEMLIQKNADINIVPMDGKTALYVACRYGHVKIVELLLNKGADYNIISTDGVSLFTAARCYNHDDVVKVLQEKMDCDSKKRLT